jgi:hypothetical protein
LFASISEGSILTVCLLVSKGYLLMTNHLSIQEKKQVIFVGMWLCISLFLNDLFRGFFLFSLVIAYICHCRIISRRCSEAGLALLAAARNMRDNNDGVRRLQYKATLFRMLMTTCLLYVCLVCIMLVIVAFVPYLKDTYIASFLVKDILLFVLLFMATVLPRILQWRFNYNLEHEIVDQLPHNDVFMGNGILQRMFDNRNFR